MGRIMDRGFVGSMPAATERDDESYLDFVEGIRVYTASKVSPVVGERSSSAVRDYVSSTGKPITTIEEVQEALSSVPVVATRNRFSRTSQEMMWQGVIDTYMKKAPELLKELELADQSGPGTVEYDPNFKYPEYFSTVEFHIQPGNYHADPLAGYIYHYGTKVFFTGRNNNDDVQRSFVQAMPLPADGQVRKIIDVGGSVGQTATALKERFPQATVYGSDISAAMVRYAHKRAIDLGLEVHFQQRAAEDLYGHADNSADIVTAFILFHEIPRHIAERVVKEAHRVLRPGGLFVVMDFKNAPKGDFSNPQSVYFRDFDTNDNGEPYATAFVQSDFSGLLKSVFRNVNDNLTPNSFLPIRVAEK